MKPNPQSDGSCVDSVKEALRISTESGGQTHDDQSGYGQLHAGNWLSAVRNMPNCQ